MEEDAEDVPDCSVRVKVSNGLPDLLLIVQPTSKTTHAEVEQASPDHTPGRSSDALAGLLSSRATLCPDSRGLSFGGSAISTFVSRRTSC